MMPVVTCHPHCPQCVQGCPRLREVGLGHLINLHNLSCFRCSMALTEAGLGLLVSSAGVID
jgi:hypothetical protein